MGRFIFLTFGFLAVAFYELSGGADFDPKDAAENLVTARAEKKNLPLDAPAIVTTSLEEPQDTVSRASLNLVSFDAAATESPQPENIVPAVASEPVAVQEPTETAAVVEPRVTSLGVGSLSQPDISGVTFAGLTASASSDVVNESVDIRTVTGSLVNMRSGPGTDFDVVGQLPRNTQVEVISDTGTGWVELRPTDGGATGWMADFLLSGG